VRNVALVLVVGAVLSDSLESPWKERAKIVVILLLLGLIGYATAAIVRLRRASGAVLLDFPHPWPAIRLLQGMIAFVALGCGVFCLVSLLLYPMGLEAAVARGLFGLLLLVAGLLLLDAALSRLQFTERGVFSPSGYIAWEDVAAYQWEGNDTQTLRLVPRRFLPFFGPLPWPIPAEQKRAVEAVLASRVPAANQAVN
jgi:hypothetical protein